MYGVSFEHMCDLYSQKTYLITDTDRPRVFIKKVGVTPPQY